MSIDRRTLAKSTAWVVPAITVSAFAPSFAASDNSIELDVYGCKGPGSTGKKWSYHIRILNSGISVDSVEIDGVMAINDGDRWDVCDMGESQAFRNVIVVLQDGRVWGSLVKFLPCPKDERPGLCG